MTRPRPASSVEVTTPPSELAAHADPQRGVESRPRLLLAKPAQLGSYFLHAHHPESVSSVKRCVPSDVPVSRQRDGLEPVLPGPLADMLEERGTQPTMPALATDTELLEVR